MVTGMEVLDFSNEWLQSYPDFNSELSLDGHKGMLVLQGMYADGRIERRSITRTP